MWIFLAIFLLRWKSERCSVRMVGTQRTLDSSCCLPASAFPGTPSPFAPSFRASPTFFPFFLVFSFSRGRVKMGVCLENKSPNRKIWPDTQKAQSSSRSEDAWHLREVLLVVRPPFVSGAFFIIFRSERSSTTIFRG